MAEKKKVKEKDYSANLEKLVCGACGRTQLKGVDASTCVACGGVIK